MILTCEQLLLPFAEKEYIDVPRAARILGVDECTVRDFHQAGKIVIIDYAKFKRKRVHYGSVVAFCDELRTKFSIADRRPQLSNQYLRHRDCDLLPFPLSDTLNMRRVKEILGFSTANPVIWMIEEGQFEAYNFLPNSPWRISRSSLAAYLAQVHAKAHIQPIPEPCSKA